MGHNVLFFHVDNLGFGELSRDSGGPFRGVDPWYDPERDPVSRIVTDPQEREPVDLVPVPPPGPR